jgi:hypothetical protein
MANATANIGQLYATVPVVQSKLGSLSLTSQYKASLLLGSPQKPNKSPTNLTEHLTNCNLLKDTDKYDFMCAEAVLPGSTFDVSEEFGSRQGVIERFPNRRVYSDFNLTFYVDRQYDLIRLFEEWMNYIDPIYDQNGQYNGKEEGYQLGYRESNNYYRFKYPNTYKKSIAITKFERDFLPNPNSIGGPLNNPTSLTYFFVDAFPTNLTALPLSYEGSTITKTTVNFSYTRYTVNKNIGKYIQSTENSKNPAVPDQPISESPNNSNNSLKLPVIRDLEGTQLPFGTGIPGLTGAQYPGIA